MGIQELLKIIVECRKIIIQASNSSQYSDLIHKIDAQLMNYQNRRELFNARKISPNSSRKKSSKKKIFVESSKKHKLLKNDDFTASYSQIIASFEGKQQQFQPQQSNVLSVSLDSINFGWQRKHQISQIFQDKPDELLVNNSFDQIPQLPKKSHSQKQIIQKKKSVEIEDFFIIDFNANSNQYEILPKRQNFFDKCNFLNQLFDSQKKQSKFRKGNESNNQKFFNQKQKFVGGVFPFLQITQKDQGNRDSQISVDTLRSDPHYSTEVQLSEASKFLNYSNNKNSSNNLTSSNIQQLYQMRQVILNLLTCDPSFHIKQIKLSSSMTDLLKLTNNPSSKNSKLQHIIIPSFIQIRQKHNFDTCNRFTHIIKTQEPISNGLKHFQFERFYVLVEREKRFIEVQQIVRGLIIKGFELRIRNQKDIDNVEYSDVKKYIQQISLIPRHHLAMFMKKGQNNVNHGSIYSSINFNPCDPLMQVYQYCQSAMKYKFTLQTPPNLESKSFNLLLILIYFIVFEYKIVFLASKGSQSIISELINGLIHMIGSLRYVYPVILAVLTSHHIQFVNSPVPGLVALWGSESRYKKSITFMKNKLKQQTEQIISYHNKKQLTSSIYQNSLSTIVIDMNKHQFINHDFTHKQLYIIENLHNYVKTKNKQQNLIESIKNLFNFRLLLSQKQQAVQNNWINILRQRLMQTQMYEEYMKYQESLLKK